jgi:hypothetical protein
MAILERFKTDGSDVEATQASIIAGALITLFKRADFDVDHSAFVASEMVLGLWDMFGVELITPNA